MNETRVGALHVSIIPVVSSSALQNGVQPPVAHPYSANRIRPVHYRISEPVKFLFEVREPSETLRYISESVMREVAGDRTVDEVITIDRQEIASPALIKMQALSTKYAMGISIAETKACDRRFTIA